MPPLRKFWNAPAHKTVNFRIFFALLFVSCLLPIALRIPFALGTPQIFQDTQDQED
jgi:hypothetical protein